MGGRGGGFKASTSLRPEQLQGMGITGKDMPSSIAAPPPTFPPLATRPAPLEQTPERDFMIDWKDHFHAYLKDSPYHTSPKGPTKRSHSRLFYDTSNSNGPYSAFVWPSMPAELRPNWKRKVNAAEVRQKKMKVVNVEETLKALEQKEISRKRKENDNHAVKEETKSDNENDEENVEDEEQDDEMDEDNDYGFSYFDNGDDYNDEDDNLDDGPVY